MPLPENWKGLFYSKDTCGDYLFDMDGGEFAAFVQESPEQGPPFLVAGAVFDLTMNGHKDRADDFLSQGRTVWPDAPWDWLQNMLETLDELIFHHEDRELPEGLQSFISYNMQMSFCGWAITVIPISSN